MNGLEFPLMELLKVTLLNLVLSGDNSVVIALACRNLPPHLQRQAFFYGSCGSIVLKIALTFVATALLALPFLQLCGGVMLLVIAGKLLAGDEEGAEVRQQQSLLKIIRTILIADVVMSLDNTIAVAATAKGSLLLIIAGLTISTPLVIVGAGLITKLLNRYPLLVYAAAGLLAFTSGEMILDDEAVGPYLLSLLPNAASWLPWALVPVLVLYGVLQRRKTVPVSWQRL